MAKFKRILDKTQNLWDLYRYYCGKSEVPPQFDYWCFFSLIAAALANRVSLPGLRGANIDPNLYVMLIAKSGEGKGQAINIVERLVAELPIINAKKTSMTKQYVMDLLAKAHKTEEGEWEQDNSKLFLLTPELSHSLGNIQNADVFIKFACEIYGGASPLSQEDGTRTRGTVSFSDHCLNWLGGSTMQWLLSVIPRDAIYGGYFARTVAVMDRKNYAIRVFDDPRPPDYFEVEDYLKERILALTLLRGEFRMSSEAHEFMLDWYLKRDEPLDDFEAPFWNRERVLCSKFAMLVSAAESPKLVIERSHVVVALAMLQKAKKFLPELVACASENKETEGMLYIKDLIKKRQMIPAFQLHKSAASYGIVGDRLKMIIESLKLQRLVGVTTGPRGGVQYVWLRRRGSVKDVGDVSGDTES